MSGGVDSSVAAALLHAQDYEVIGVTMQLWGKDVCVTAGSRLCCSVRDSLDAKTVAKRLGIEHETLELVEEFQSRVIEYFTESYREGLTPNPCIACNTHIKFGKLFDRADELGARLVATGHYARIAADAATGRASLRRAADHAKDQSYVLFDLAQAQLSRAMFPLGELSKDEVRATARELGLATADKPDSQDICFVRDGNKTGFLAKQLGSAGQPGPITDTAGRLLGRHQGLYGFTVGQREGIGLAVGRALYVVAIDRAQNRLVVGGKDELLGRSLVAERVNWVSIEPPAQALRAYAKIRSRHEPAAAFLIPGEGGAVRVEFDEPQPAITPGQAVVFYDGDLLLGGGWIRGARLNGQPAGARSVPAAAAASYGAAA